ncbi:MAG: tetratricopeptide repeat protein [Nitrospirae bacterium]|nr:tetratricopeptide repeat protein [Nitrospirota bacterium]
MLTDKTNPSIINTIGLILFLRGKQEDALSFYNMALEGFKDISNKRGEGTTLFNIAMLYRTTNEPEKANEYFNKVAAINVTLKNQELTQRLASIGIKSA